MPARLARNALISLVIFALVFAVTRSNLALATTLGPYLEAVLTQSTDLAEVSKVARDVARGLLTWNPWSRGPGGAPKSENGDDRGNEAPPGGGPEGDPGAVDILEPPALSLAHVPEDGAVVSSTAREAAKTTLPSPPVAAPQSRSVATAAPATPSRDSASASAARESQPKASAGAAPSGSPARGRDQLRLAVPVGGQVTYGFGYRVHPIYKRRLFHQGIDIAAPRGTPVRAVAAARVLRAGPCGTYGKIVELDHGRSITTLYAHCSKVLVKAGDNVRAGQKIAEVGSTGLSTGPHLHFEVAVNGKPQDPFAYLEGGRRDRL